MSYPGPDMYEDWREWAQQLITELVRMDGLTPKAEPAGKISVFYMQVGPGYLLCNGETFSTATFPQLALKLGSDTLPALDSVFGPEYVVGIKT